LIKGDKHATFKHIQKDDVLSDNFHVGLMP